MGFNKIEQAGRYIGGAYDFVIWLGSAHSNEQRDERKVIPVVSIRDKAGGLIEIDSVKPCTNLDTMNAAKMYTHLMSRGWLNGFAVGKLSG